MHTLMNQFRYIFRKLAKSPLFTVISVLTIALAIGANTAIFSVVHGVLLKPLPFEDSDRLVGVWHEAPGSRLRQGQPGALPTFHLSGSFPCFRGRWDMG